MYLFIYICFEFQSEWSRRGKKLAGGDLRWLKFQPWYIKYSGKFGSTIRLNISESKATHLQAPYSIYSPRTHQASKKNAKCVYSIAVWLKRVSDRSDSSCVFILMVNPAILRKNFQYTKLAP